jgi:diaminopimelate decarboxylase
MPMRLLAVDLPAFELSLRETADAARRLIEMECPVAEVSVGAGLGTPHREGDEPLELSVWAACLSHHLGPLQVKVGVEPSEYLVRNGAILLTKAVNVVERHGSVLIAADAGSGVRTGNTCGTDASDFVKCSAADALCTNTVVVTGNLDAGTTVYADRASLPTVFEGDILAVMGAGFAPPWDRDGSRLPLRTLFFQERTGQAQN